MARIRSVKPEICDGLVTYGLVPDDTSDHFGGVMLLPPIKDPTLPHAVLVTITEVEL